MSYVFELMGRHSLSIFILIPSNIAIIIIQGFYWKQPKNNIVSLLSFTFLYLHFDFSFFHLFTIIMIFSEFSFFTFDYQIISTDLCD